MFHLKRKSDWTFDTSSGAGVSLGLMGLEKGAFYLRPQPTIGQSQCFNYEAIGLCVGFGGRAGSKIPIIAKAPKLQMNLSKSLGISANGAGKAALSKGVVIVTANCQTRDLVRDDFLGLCAFAEIYGGYGYGASLYAFYFGIPASRLPIAGVSAFAGSLPIGLLYSAKGILLMGGLNLGVQSGFCVGGFLGSVFLDVPYSPGLSANPSTGSEGASGVNSSSGQYGGGGGAPGF